MLKRVQFLFFVLAISLAAYGTAFADSKFDGKWFMDAEMLIKSMPPEMQAEIEKNSSEIQDAIKEQFKNSYMVITTKDKTIEVLMSGEPPKKDTFVILEESKDKMKIKASTDKEALILTLIKKDKMEMRQENDQEIIYFTR